MTGPLLIAIDGPAGSGKSTLGRALATALGIPYVNTGLMYRALTLESLEHGIGSQDGTKVAALVDHLVFTVGGSDPAALLIDGRPPASELWSASVEAEVSHVARHLRVRERMHAEQRRLGAGGAVMEGRDIATVVFPDATLKIFLEATPEVRAARRMSERGGGSAVADALHRRDRRDDRVNPLEPADDAFVVDTSDLPADAVRAMVLEELDRRWGG